MHASDPRELARDLFRATGLLTRIPVPPVETAPGGMAAAAWAWPLIGALVGAVGAGVAAIAAHLGLPVWPAAVLGLAAMVLLTGGLHEDGLADTADGLFGGATRERRLEIMRDSRVGSYGVLALGLVLILRWSCIAALLAAGSVWALIAAAAISRAGMAALMAALPHARPDGLAQITGRPSRSVALVAVGIGLVVAVFCPGGIGAAALAALALVWIGRMAQARIGGQTGDILGASCQLAEAAAMVVIAAAV
ncbi:adenosylcobinamide-GDP ribazoletransferase [Rhodobacterales bacterium HKCCE3408]|nr:adenosylcobinamide-GDP ribazoletransferase [Rhodobacterales bacterium HKCCE3408]